MLTAQGDLDGALASSVLAALTRALDASPAPVIIDLRGVTSYDEAGAQGLLRAHEALAARSRRSAYLLDRPRIRALVFKVIHATQDERTRPVATLEMAERWLHEPSTQSFADASLERTRTLLDRFRGKLALRGATSR